MNKNRLQISIMFLIILAVSIACNAVTGIGERLGKTKDTVEAVATQAREGADLLATVRAISTKVGSSALIETAQALATELDDSGLLKTAQAFATEQAPALIETARAVATQEVPGYIETAQAFATQEGPGYIETAQALATQVAGNLGEAPEDIPLVAGERNQFYGIKNLVFYLSPLPYPDVLAFYKEQMPVNGWIKTEQGSVEAENAVVLMYEKAERKASVALSIDPVDHQTIVLITIFGQ